MPLWGAFFGAVGVPPPSPPLPGRDATLRVSSDSPSVRPELDSGLLNQATPRRSPPDPRGEEARRGTTTTGARSASGGGGEAVLDEEFCSEE